MIVSDKLLKAFTTREQLIKFNNGDECECTSNPRDDFQFEITVPIPFVKDDMNLNLKEDVIILQQTDPDVFDPPKEESHEITNYFNNLVESEVQPKFVDMSKDKSRNTKDNHLVAHLPDAKNHLEKQQELQLISDGEIIGRAWVLKIGPGDQVKLKFDEDAMKVIGDDIMSALKYLTI